MARERAIQIRVSNKEYEAIQANADQAGVSLSEWMRVRALTHGGSLGRVALPDTDPSDGYVAEMRHVSDPPELTKKIKQLEARPGVSPAQARERALKQLGLN